MTKVFLYGALREKFGREFKFHINSAKEALLAINSNRRGFLEEVKRLGAKGVQFQVVIDDGVPQDIKEFDVRKNISEIHIIPALWGAGGLTGLFKVLLAVVIAVVAVITKSFVLPKLLDIFINSIIIHKV